ncbi:MAG TPA: hypothetical protein VJJ47_02290 [Candidatus Paceibacterota bacterium]
MSSSKLKKFGFPLVFLVFIYAAIIVAVFAVIVGPESLDASLSTSHSWIYIYLLLVVVALAIALYDLTSPSPYGPPNNDWTPSNNWIAMTCVGVAMFYLFCLAILIFLLKGI